MRSFALTLAGIACLLLASCHSLVRPVDIGVPLQAVPDAEAVGVFHTVQTGETLSSIVRNYGADLQEVAEINGLDNPDSIQVGQQIFLPDVVGHQPSADPTASPTGTGAPSTEPAPSVKTYQNGFIWPVNGVVTSKFGIRNKKRHDGIDISAPEGTEVMAVADGEVLFAGDQKGGYGILVILRHADEIISVYAHNQSVKVQEGQWIKQGQTISLVGRTGRVTGPHLHFEIRKSTKPRNPLFFLPRRD